MATGRKFNKKPATRPRKSGAARARRDRQHVKRLVELGMPEEKAQKLTSKEVRTLLKTPVKTAKVLAEAKA